MKAIIVNDEQYNYLGYVINKFCELGLPTAELQIAAEIWNAVSTAKDFELPVKHVINSDVKVEINGSVTLPVEP